MASVHVSFLLLCPVHFVTSHSNIVEHLIKQYIFKTSNWFVFNMYDTNLYITLLLVSAQYN